jgi:Repeat of unknown function (DUF346)
MIWREFTELGGSLQGTPALAGWTTRNLNLAARGTNNNVMVGWRDDTGWLSAWDDIGLAGTDQPAVALINGMLCVFSQGTDNALWVGGAMAPEGLGGDVQSAPTVAYWHLDSSAHIFVRGSDNAVWHLAWSPGSIPGNWQSIGGSIDGAPSAVAWGPNRIDVFARGRSPAHLMHCWWDGSNWSTWEDLGGLLLSWPSAISRDIGSLEVYYADFDSTQLAVRSFNGQWQPARAIGQLPDSTPCAFSFGPTHVEVFDTSAKKLRRLYAEGVRPGDDPASVTTQFSSAPACAAIATTTIHCLARGADNHLHHISYDDGFWNQWEDLGGVLNGDPVAVSPASGILDLAVCGQNNEIYLRRLNADVWSDWIDTAGVTNDPITGIKEGNQSRFLVRGTDNHLYEGVVAIDNSWQGWRDLGGNMTTPPHIAVVDVDALPKPPNALGPNVAIAAGAYVCALNTSGTTSSRRFARGATDWEAWTPFADGNARIAKPLYVTWPLGFASVGGAINVGEVSQAGWVGRTATGDLQVFALWWQEAIEPGFVSYTNLGGMPWTTIPTFVPGIVNDPVGIIMLEPFGGSVPIEPATWAFARQADGLLMFSEIDTLAPAHAYGWGAFGGYRAMGDPALLILWERYEDVQLLHAVFVNDAGQLVSRSGTYEAEPVRVRPTPSGTGRKGIHRPILIHKPIPIH